MMDGLLTTLDDVAREAGVSRATVDRVINNRSGVRDPTMRRVRDAMAKLQYQPDPIAARLARRARYRFCFVLPAGTNNFMDSLSAEIARTAAWLVRQRGFIDRVETDIFDPRQLARTLGAIDGTYRGVAVVALDHPIVATAINRLVEAGTTVVTLVSDVPSSQRIRFIGIDNCAAGRTAASLLGRFSGARQGSVGVLVGSLSLRDHMDRCFGFGQVLAADYPHLSILPVRETRDDSAVAHQAVQDLCRADRNLVGIYNAGAGNQGVGTALTACRRPDLIVIGHELTDASRGFLKDGLFDAIIAQDAGHEARSAARVLLAHAAGDEIVADQERIGIDIFLRDNLP